MTPTTIKWRGRAIPAVLPGVEFDEVRHEYKVDGAKWPNVTGFLEDYYHGPQDSKGARWGDSAHKHVFHFMKRTIDLARVKESMRPTLDGWMRALAHFNIPEDAEMLAEYIVYSSKFRFIGRLDFLFALKEIDLLLDLKTGEMSEMGTRKTGLQLGGYCQAIIEHGLSTLKRLRAAEVNIQPDGNMTPHLFPNMIEIMQTFLAQVKVKNYFRKL
jgi:hypothetical protein